MKLDTLIVDVDGSDVVTSRATSYRAGVIVGIRSRRGEQITLDMDAVTAEKLRDALLVALPLPPSDATAAVLS